jgi:hypothetical protein
MWRALQQCQALHALRLLWRSGRERYNTHQSLNLQPVSTLTQLQSLDLKGLIDSSFSCTSLTTLTALTSLSMRWQKIRRATLLQRLFGFGAAGHQQQQVQQDKWEHKRQQGQELQLAISHLRHLKDLAFYRVSMPAGIAENLAQLTGLTRLCMHNTEPDESWYLGACHQPVVLPSVEQLSLHGQKTLQFLAGTHLPLLADVWPNIKLSADTAARQAQLFRSKMGLLQHCHDITLTGPGNEVAVAELGSMLATLASVWQQPPSKGIRELLLVKLACPRAAMSQVPVRLTTLAFE